MIEQTIHPKTPVPDVREHVDLFEYLGVHPDDEFEEWDRKRYCDNGCAHYDGLNACCWQATNNGLCFDVEEGNPCHLGYMEDDGR